MPEKQTAGTYYGGTGSRPVTPAREERARFALELAANMLPIGGMRLGSHIVKRLMQASRAKKVHDYNWRLTEIGKALNAGVSEKALQSELRHLIRLENQYKKDVFLDNLAGATTGLYAGSEGLNQLQSRAPQVFGDSPALVSGPLLDVLGEDQLGNTGRTMLETALLGNLKLSNAFGGRYPDKVSAMLNNFRSRRTKLERNLGKGIRSRLEMLGYDIAKAAPRGQFVAGKGPYAPPKVIYPNRRTKFASQNMRKLGQFIMEDLSRKKNLPIERILSRITLPSATGPTTTAGRVYLHNELKRLNEGQ